MSIIDVKGLTAYYENRPIFTNLDFSVENGDFLFVVGENGSGKTTLMRCLLGLKVKHTGNIVFNGISRREIGYLPQKTEYQNDFPASVFEVVTSGLSGSGLLGLPLSKKKRLIAEEKMKMLEILDLKDRPYGALSGGQQQKVLLCRALCATGKALLLDEPTTALDAVSKDELYSLISKLNDSKTAVIVISHDIDRAVSNAKHILHVSEESGFFGTPEEYVKSGFYKRIKGAAQ